jgi:hypothetical protein
MHSRTANTTLTFIEGHIGASDAAELGRAVQALTEIEAWDRVMEFCGRMEDDTMNVLTQEAHDHATYLYNHGMVRGLQATRDIADAIIEAGRRAERALEQLIHADGGES